MNRKSKRWIILMLCLTGILFAVSFFSLCTGTVKIPFTKVLSILFTNKETTEHLVLHNIRLHRIMLGFAVGGALSVAGVILQGMFRNVLVEPYTLGISGGAALGICLNMVFGLSRAAGNYSMPLCGFLGALLVMILVYSLSTGKGILRIRQLLLTGVMISFISSSMIMFIMAVSRTEDLHGIIFWIMGSLQETSWSLVKLAVVLSVLGLLASYFFCHDLNAFSTGEEEAQHLGVNIERTKRILFIISAMLTGLSVSVAGIIGFVGLVVPHFVRMFMGGDHRGLLAGSFLCGASFLILCDTLARTIISPMELPVGVITGIIGGMLFIYALSRKKAVLGGN